VAVPDRTIPMSSVSVDLPGPDVRRFVDPQRHLRDDLARTLTGTWRPNGQDLVPVAASTFPNPPRHPQVASSLPTARGPVPAPEWVPGQDPRLFMDSQRLSQEIMRPAPAQPSLTPGLTGMEDSLMKSSARHIEACQNYQKSIADLGSYTEEMFSNPLFQQPPLSPQPSLTSSAPQTPSGDQPKVDVAVSEEALQRAWDQRSAADKEALRRTYDPGIELEERTQEAIRRQQMIREMAEIHDRELSARLASSGSSPVSKPTVQDEPPCGAPSVHSTEGDIIGTIKDWWNCRNHPACCLGTPYMGLPSGQNPQADAIAYDDCMALWKETGDCRWYHKAQAIGKSRA
jgi:hypothetical protein